MFFQVYVKFIPQHKRPILKKLFKNEEFQEDIDSKTINSFKQLFYVFGDFARWDKIRKNISIVSLKIIRKINSNKLIAMRLQQESPLF